ncbi:hypothetical protein L2D00_01480 [Hyphomonadaceae bacterium BL14]|nr:hypothetical protein L2D00_01480 [Hyphomonadaceae bacterium BL14]
MHWSVLPYGSRSIPARPLSQHTGRLAAFWLRDNKNQTFAGPGALKDRLLLAEQVAFYETVADSTRKKYAAHAS